MTLHFDLKTLISNQKNKILFQATSGSRAYGLARAHSDEDIRGIFVLPSNAYLSIEPPINLISDERSDIVYYSLRRVLELIKQSNPNIIELLFTPEDCIKFKSPFIHDLFQVRQEFISMELCDAFIGFAQMQLKKSRGQNKWVNKPQPPSLPKKEDFIWIVPHLASNTFPARPVSLNSTQIDLAGCHVSSLEHCPNVYRLYKISNQAKGVFRNEEIVCQSIELKDEIACFVGLLIFNKLGFDTATRDFKHYWQWHNNRNEQRWKLQEGKIIDYDSKNMMHMFRLLFSSENILRFAKPLVRIEGENKIFLNDVLDGKYNFNELVSMAHAKIDELNKLKEKASVPDKPNTNIIDELLYSITLNWESGMGSSLDI